MKDLLSAEDTNDIQSWIYSGYPHLPKSTYAFLRIDDQIRARQFLKGIPWQISSATKSRNRQAQSHQVLNVAFTAMGLLALGIDDETVEKFPIEFQEGMNAPHRGAFLGDISPGGKPDHTVRDYAASAVHLLFACHFISASVRDSWISKFQRDSSAGGLSLVGLELGELADSGKEHFGFKDGISNPEIHGFKGAGSATGEFILGYPNEQGCMPVSPLLSPESDPHDLLPPAMCDNRNMRDLGRNGTYLVFRKLAQDVSAFWNFIADDCRRRLGRAEPADLVWLASKLVGRWPNGVSLVEAPHFDAYSEIMQERLKAGSLNDFTYGQTDTSGHRCPFAAHVARMNPRDRIQGLSESEALGTTARHRLLRRGRRYGPELFDLKILDTPESWNRLQQLFQSRPEAQDTTRSDRGLFFIAFCANIREQFEFVQRAWGNNPHFNSAKGSQDPLIGTNSSITPGRSGIPIPDRDGGITTGLVPQAVSFRGGGYFFLPSIAAFRWICHGK